MRLLTRIYLVPLAALLFSGCSLFKTEAPVSAPAAAPVVATPAPIRHAIWVKWQVPSEAVDGFIIRYGGAPDALTKEVTLSTIDLAEENDAKYGPIYRYLIKDVENFDRVFVAIAAIKGQRISNFSEPLAGL